ncbi:MAG: 3-oxoacyl-[acyl-carrier protein] reductase (EC [uncultured Paraburkholderia sp.]|nr:MAG: 3-oxoacyl-[acyl-carrier protein] reductase (EC [uncultured Paraburkholderia sp.]CAH2910774.1 MAG: 3-oxoacyl-[acyl-carrier protein] reductase (EC [uncultured Paraburkholderia sp.]
MTKPVLLITGGTRGIGAAVARHAARAGWIVHVWGRDVHSGEALAHALSDCPGECFYRQVDVTDYVTLEREYARLAGEHHVAYAFNNAGISAAGSLATVDVDTVRHCFDTNVFGLWANLRFQLADMTNAGQGVIVNNHSIHAVRAVFPGVGIYAASKAAGAALTRAAALEAGPAGIRVNGIAPGPVDTKMYHQSLVDSADAHAWPSLIPLGRIGTEDEVAETVMFLFSSGAAFINGQIIGIDGGASCY